MNNYKYQLDKSSRKFHCPACGKKKFVRYMDMEINQYIDDKYGRCDREISCGFFSNPYKDSLYLSNKTDYNPSKRRKQEKTPTGKLNPLPYQVLRQTFGNFNENTFLQYLLEGTRYPFPVKTIEKLAELYILGTVAIGYRKGAITFPFIDIDKNIRAIQVKCFDSQNHTIATDFIHSICEREYKKAGSPQPEWLKLYLQNEKKVSCLFGEHLLKQYPDNPIALVEAPKSALYGSLYFGFPDNPENFLWLAVYNISSISYEKCKVLKGRNVVLFPDLSPQGKAFNFWREKADELNAALPDTSFVVSDILENYAKDKERQKGFDIADYLITQDWRKFQDTYQYELAFLDSYKQSIAPEPAHKNSTELKRTWDLEPLKVFFQNLQKYPECISLGKGVTVMDIKHFARNHLEVLFRYNGNPKFEPYLERLILAKKIIESGQTG